MFLACARGRFLLGLRCLLAEVGNVLLGKRQGFRAESSGNVIGDGGNLEIGEGFAKSRHRNNPSRRLPMRARYNNLRDVDRARIIDGARTGQGCKR